jgi:hypothetical protein
MAWAFATGKHIFITALRRVTFITLLNGPVYRPPQELLVEWWALPPRQPPIATTNNANPLP